MSSELLRVEGLTVRWDGGVVLDDLSFQVADGEYAVLMGPNGSGKTTLLRALVGLGPIPSGSIWFAGRRVDHDPTHRRGIGLLFQDPALFPGRTVAENIAYGLEIRGDPPDAVDARVNELARLLHLEPLLLRRATELSGGEQQRVALARSLAPRPKLLLLDEPFASVDPQLRGELRAEFRAVLRSMGVAVIHVTHDREEGLFLADRVLLLYDGRLVRTGRPDEVFEHPRTPEAAEFLGYNLVRDGPKWWAVHPRDLVLGPSRPGGLAAEVVQFGDVGHERIALLRGPAGERLEARGPGVPELLAPGEKVGVRWSRASSISSEAGGATSPGSS